MTPQPRPKKLPRLLSALALASLALAISPHLGSAQQQAPVNRNRLAQQLLPFVPVPAADNKEKDENFTSGVKLPVDPRARRKLEMAHQYIKTQDWTQAIKLLQSLLDSKEDVFLQDEGKSRRISVRAEANQLLGALPREGLQFYEQEYGVPARLLLRQGQASGDPQIYAEVALRYLHTEAGGEAAALLGAYHLDQGQFITAALCFERLADRPDGLAKLNTLQLFKAALAFERGGDPANRDRAWAMLESKLDQPGETGLPAGLRAMSRSDLRASLATPAGADAALQASNWPMFLGSPDRVAQGIGSVPYLEPRFGYPLDTTKSLQAKSAPAEAVRGLLDKAVRKQGAMNWPLMVGSHPLAVGDLLVYRGAWGVHAVDVKSGQVRWESRSAVGLAAMASPRSGLQDNSLVSTWLNYYHEQFPWLFYDNSMLGTLSTDQLLVYAVEDLAVPPANDFAYANRFPGQQVARGGGEITRWFAHNKLVAYDLDEQGVVWEIGTTDEDNPFADTFFLGAPLPLGGKLYTLAETNGEIRLLCLQTQRNWDAENNRWRYAAELVWSQPLCLVHQRITEMPLRRTQAVQLAYSDGILVCPTHAGVVIGVDLLTRTLVWAHAYQVQENPQEGASAGFLPPGMNRRFIQMGAVPPGYGPASFNKPTWGSAAPMIAQGVVVFTAPDAKFVHALSLKDGHELWRQPLDNRPKSADLYLAGIVDGKVLVVGQSATRALDLKSGQTVWTLPTGTPSGRGVASNSIYYLPVRAGEGKALEGGEVWAIQIDKGEVVSRSRSKLEAPGNLIFHDGEMISQSVHSLVVYPQLSAKEAEITARLRRNPDDPSGLAQRGEMRLYRGDLAAAVTDLRAALRSEEMGQPERLRAEEKLFESLYELTEKDFSGHEAELPELEKLVAIAPTASETELSRQKRESEQLERRARYLRLVAQGRRQQGALAAALAAYLDFANLGGELIPSPDDSTLLVAPLVWAQGRVESMLRDATPEQRSTLNADFEKSWQDLQRKPEVDMVRRFAEFYAPLCGQGREAQLLLAELLLKQKEYLEAGIWLNRAIQDSDANRAARACEAMARLFIAVGELENAAHYYRLLAQKYPNEVIRDGKRATQIYEELSTDKRFLPFLSLRETSKRGLLGQVYQKIEMLEPRQVGGNPGIRGLVWLDPSGSVPPLFQKYRIGVDVQRRQVQIVDRGTDEERRSFPLQSLAVAYLPQSRAAGTYEVFGQVVVFSWTNVIYAYDLIGDRLLWTQDVLAGMDTPASSYGGYTQVQLVPDRNGRFKLINANTNTQEWVGMLGTAQANGVCFTQKDRGLVMVDPLTGKERWIKTDVPTSVEIFGDAEQVFLIAPKPERKNRPPLALRALDGSSATVPDFAAAWDSKVQQVGRHLLLKETEDEAVTLLLRDPSTGENIWTLPLGKGGWVLNSLVSQVAGGVTADGELTLVDMRDGAVLLNAKVPLGDLEQLQGLHLLADVDRWYLFFNRRPEQPKEAGKVVIRRMPSQYSFSELRTVDVHGPVFAFDRISGKQAWQADLPVQGLVVDQFDELPFVLCACMLHRWTASERVRTGHRQYSSALALDKRDGSLIDAPYDRDGNPYVDLRLDAAAGQVELIGQNMKLMFQLVPETASAADPRSNR